MSASKTQIIVETPRRRRPSVTAGMKKVTYIRDPVRDLIVERLRATGHTMDTLSAVCGRNRGFMSCFLHRGTPRILKEAYRDALANVLGVRPEELLPPVGSLPLRRRKGASEVVPFRPAEAPPENRNLPPDAADPVERRRVDTVSPLNTLPPDTPLIERRRYPAPQAYLRPSIPMFREDEAITPAAATKWAARPSSMTTDGDAVAIAVLHGCSRVRPGDVLIAADRAPRQGDLTVILNRADQVAAIGDLAHADQLTVRLHTGQGLTDYDRAHFRVLKVTDLVLA